MSAAAFRRALMKERQKERAALPWGGMCPADLHGLDYKGQHCDVCDVKTKKTNPVGRPPRTKIASEVRFEIRLTGKERDKWQAAADKQGLTLAELVRESVETCISRGSSR